MVDAALNAVREAVASGMDWRDLARMIKVGRCTVLMCLRAHCSCACGLLHTGLLMLLMQGRVVHDYCLLDVHGSREAGRHWYVIQAA